MRTAVPRPRTRSEERRPAARRRSLASQPRRPARPPRPAAEETPAGEATPARQRAGATSGAHTLLLALVGTLCLTGLIMVLSASSVESIRAYGSPWHFFERQVVWQVVGIGAFAVASKMGPGGARRFARVGMVVVFAMLCAVLMPGLGKSVAGASRWIGTSSVQIQPSELAKLCLVLFAADVLDRRAGKRDWRYQMAPVILVLVGLVMLVMLQPDMGTAMVLAGVAVAMLFTAGIPGKPLAGLFAAAAGCFGLLAIAAPYRVRRLTSFLHPLADASNTGYQASQGLAAMGHGQLLGAGIGSSISSWGYLPNAQTDFIFAVVGEEMGMVGALVLTGLFAALALVGTRIACRCPDRHAALIAAGVTAWLTGQALINIGAVVGLLPVTGVPLPFVSFGGSSLVIAMFGVGLVAHSARQP